MAKQEIHLFDLCNRFHRVRLLGIIHLAASGVVSPEKKSVRLKLTLSTEVGVMFLVTLLLLHDKDKVYLKGKDKIVPPFRFGVEDVATKMWFHKLAYPGQCLTNSTESHWILGRLNIEERRMYMYNSLSTAMKDSAAIKACQPFAVLLPHFFALFDEFKKENKPVCLDPFEVVKVDGLPQQTSNDCGCFVASFAEYFIDMKPISPIFDVKKHRDRLAVLFYKYARMKELDFIDSEDEAPPKGPKKNLS
ncbi:hypothetical protein F8388_000200 [Cannabis sativa]|uniref:Ubiquitin-like protease family profile domain-containing protein n=1 Tax=Cannabis sativa TaxID=3483 RepID=A0A7J6F0X1_CANSA|nr:hypothetical protein F8388_000200 [Cannabis sativa]